MLAEISRTVRTATNSRTCFHRWTQQNQMIFIKRCKTTSQSTTQLGKQECVANAVRLIERFSVMVLGGVYLVGPDSSVQLFMQRFAFIYSRPHPIVLPVHMCVYPRLDVSEFTSVIVGVILSIPPSLSPTYTFLALLYMHVHVKINIYISVCITLCLVSCGTQSV